MKAYRKKLIGLALAAVLSFSPVSVFASSVNITSGLQIGGDEVECTFDSSRILYGEAKPGGVLGISGLSNDYRDLLEEEDAGNEAAHNALEVLVYRVIKYIGAYHTA